MSRRRLLGAMTGMMTLSSRRMFTDAAGLNVFRGDTMGGAGIVMLPKSVENPSKDSVVKNVFIFLHGLGDTCAGWASMFHDLNIPNTKMILPTAESIPITLNNGYEMPGWFDIRSLTDLYDEDRYGMDNSAQRISAIIEKEISAGVDPQNIVVGGFSQGGAIAFHCALRSPHKLGGCVALSTWLPASADLPQKIGPHAHTLPILQYHGVEDQVVLYEYARTSHDLLKTLLPNNPNLRFEYEMYLPHSSSEKELQVVADFVNSIFNK